MASEQIMNQALTQAVIDTTKAAIITVREIKGTTDSRRSTYAVPGASRLALRQP